MLRSQISDRGEARRGMVAAQVAVSLTALMGMLALLVDGGILLSERRHAQATADAAALAAASDLYANWYTNFGADKRGTANTSALNVASSNGYTNDTTTNTVTVNIPPASGNFKNKAGYVEVIVTWNQKRGFSRIFGTAAIPVSARAVAQGRAVSTTPAVLLLSSAASPALSAVGNASLDVVVTGKNPASPDGDVVVDSSAAGAVSTSGGHATLTAPAFYITGGYSGNLTATTGTIDTGATPMPDPLAYIPEPNPNSLSSQSYSGQTTLQPGVYNGGISLSGNASVTLSPGIYYMQGGGFSVTGNASVTGNGVLIYNDNGGGSIQIAGNGIVTLSPMTSGPYAGITIFQDRSSTQDVAITGNGSSTNITGAVYAADANIKAAGNGGVIGSQFIASTMSLKGNGSLNVDYSTAIPARARDFGLVE